MTQYFIMLLYAHLLADFPFQFNWIAKRKKQLNVLSIHITIHVITTMAILVLTGWRMPSAIVLAVAFGVGILHGMIDLAKAYLSDDNLNTFLIDQSVHIGMLLAAACLIQRYSPFAFRPEIAHFVIYVTGFFVIWNAASHFIDRFVKQYLPAQDKEEQPSPSGNQQASDWIGKFERLLVFGFILMGYPEGIGFIIAGKSILRFQDAKKEKMSEYILIGTLLSITIAIGVTYLCKYAAAQF